MWLIPTSAQGGGSRGGGGSAVHRSRSFDLFCRSRSLFTSGKSPAAVICAANYYRTSEKKL